MIRPRRYFPWKLARQFFFGHLLFLAVALVLTGFSLRYFAYGHFIGAVDIHQALAQFDRYLTSFLIAVFAVGAVYFLLATRHYCLPLGRIIQRARALRRMNTRSDGLEDLDEGALSEEPGEWFDLERALSRLYRDLRVNAEDLVREREELATLISAVSDAILAVDRGGAPLFYNSRFAFLFHASGTGDGPIGLGETFRVPQVLDGFRQVLESGQVANLTVSMRTLHHEVPRHFSIAIAPLRAHEGAEVYGAVGIFHDVTELKQTEQIRIEFVGNASHELRTPLTSIKGYVATLRDDIKQGRLEGAETFVDIISRNVERLILLVNDLLDLSTLESGAELKKTNISTREVTETALKSLEAKRAARQQEVHIHYHVPSFLADAQRVEQVIVNLVHNAIKYIPEGHRIDVTWEGVAGSTVLRVKDDGPGIPPEHHARLFERFYRVDAGRSREAGGTGLGLAIVKHIMLKHGGNVRIESRAGEGAEFICSFPD